MKKNVNTSRGRDSGLRVWGLGFRVWGLGFRVAGNYANSRKLSYRNEATALLAIDANPYIL